MSSIAKTLALCLAALLLLAPIFYLVTLIQTLDHKVNNLQQEPAQLHVDCPVVIIVIDSQTDPTVSTEPTNPTGTTETTQPEVTQPAVTQPKEIQSVDQQVNRPANYYGRLNIPDAGIDVGLYYGADQAICNREDSANIFSMSVYDGLYIADHITQEFAKLSSVTVGMRGYLTLTNGAVINIVCTEVITGHNTGKHIVDENGNTNLDGDYLMYTCRDSWQNILICLWKHG